MFELFRRGLNLTETLVKLPLRSAKEIMGDRKSKMREAVNITEDLVGLPFKMARQALDRAEGKEVPCKDCGGPTIRNITVNPEVTIISDEINGEGYLARIWVTGLLCDAWVNRVRRALEGFDEVTDVKFIANKEQYEVSYQAKKSLAEEMKKAIEEVVVAPGTRKILGNFGGNRQIRSKG